MKATELMIGDFIRTIYAQKIIKVREIKQSCIYTNDNGFEYNEIEPIPLTAEILEKNGFELFSRDIKYITYCINGSQISVSYVKDTKEWMVFLGASGSVKKKFVEVSCVKYIHELQHALRLCGIEKEIEL